MAALERVIRATKNEFIPRLDTSAQVEVGEAMLAALEAKYADPNYDVTADFNNTKAMYKALGSDEKSYFRTTAIAVYSGIDYTALQPIIDMILG